MNRWYETVIATEGSPKTGRESVNIWRTLMETPPFLL